MFKYPRRIAERINYTGTSFRKPFNPSCRRLFSVANVTTVRRRRASSQIVIASETLIIHVHFPHLARPVVAKLFLTIAHEVRHFAFRYSCCRF